MTDDTTTAVLPTLERLKAALGSYGRVAAALGVQPNYMTRWRALGYIPETWALDVEDLNIADAHGPVDALTVLTEARHARRAALAQCKLPA